MLVTKVFSVAALAATAMADATALTAAMNKIATQTTDLGNTVKNWKGDILGALPITAKSVELLSTINKSIKVAKDTQPLTFDEALAIATVTVDLANNVNSTLQTIIDTKPKFDKLIVLSPVVLLNLELEQDATDKFSAVVVSKVPDELKAIAQALIEPIDQSFALAIDKYRLF